MSSNGDKIFFPVKGVNFYELFDWSNAEERCKLTATDARKLRRQSSQSGVRVEVNETKIALFRYGDQLHAVNEKCPHAGGPLHIGDIEELPDFSVCVRCPWHGWKFDLKTGRCKHPSGEQRCTIVYAVRVDTQGNIEIGFESFSGKYFNSEDF
ncbi:Rieske domain-containing protein [Lingula anatina]|uniref:Rieske domain-containing protein n=1 Tax=Lingula anatina TaxID=7574 RepID=A0A1S3H7W7_LINAN|nr:Rieske domain-containing protein [Lingula anatina]|eukprot:XP_013382072.1 Rieske domain-containing protein [Lingula anatina]